MVKDEGRMSDDKELVAKGEKEKKEDRMREKKINDEEGKGKEEKKYKKREKMIIGLLKRRVFSLICIWLLVAVAVFVWLPFF